MNIYIAGCGALGSQISMHLALNDVRFILIDNDRVGQENIGTSAYDRHQAGMPKANALAELLWLRGCADTEPQIRFVDATIKTRDEYLIIDSFDNVQARSHTCGLNTVHVGVSTDRTGIILWDDSYTLPEEPEGGNPVCTHLLGRKILRMTATYAANVIEHYLETGEKRNALVTERRVIEL